MSYILYCRFDIKKEAEKKLGGCKLLVATLENLKYPNQLLIIPITIWSGLEQGFKDSDFTAVSST